MKNKSQNCNKSNQFNKSTIDLNSCDIHEEVKLDVNMCSYLPHYSTYSVLFSPCELEKKMDINAQVSCNSFHCSYIDSLISSPCFCICDESCSNYYGKPTSNDDKILTLPIHPIEEIFIDSPKCSNDKEKCSNNPEPTSEHSVDKKSTPSNSSSTDNTETTAGNISTTDSNVTAEGDTLTKDNNPVTTDSIITPDKNPTKTVDSNILEEKTTTTSHTHRKGMREGLGKRSGPSLALLVLSNLIDMFLKNCSKMEVIQEETNKSIKDEEKERSKRHKHRRSHKRHKRHKNRKNHEYINYTINDVIVILIFDLIRRLKN